MKRVAVLFLALCLCLTACELPIYLPLPEESNGLTVHFIDVGQADSALLMCDGETMLIDGGNIGDGSLVVSYLRDQGVTELDYVVGTHAHEDHIGGLPAVLAVYDAETVWCPVSEYPSECFKDFARYAGTLVCPDPGTVYTLGAAEITVLGPVEEYEDTNDTSIVLRVDYGETSFLFTGDAETQSENDILDAGYDVSATVLKVGHHGSETSSGYRWVREVMPLYAVISCGTDNEYGHPHTEPLSRLRDAEVIVYRTDLQGHIVCESDGLEVRFTTQYHAASTNPSEIDGTGQNAHGVHYIGNTKSKKFHLPTCAGLPEEKNQIKFETYDAAKEAGYSPCGNCLK